ncbi:MAG: HAD-IA family hydrolase [Oceanospirillaceae bacterium]|nr:HAD-IA family hydrolase [Oceanospirillaceae bacterium]
MSQPLEAVLFDLDGTVLDTAPDFHWVINQLLAEEGLDPVSLESLREHVSNGARAMVCAAFNIDIENSRFTDLHQRMLSLYLQHLDVHTTPFQGISDLLDWLEQHQVPWGIVTNKPELYTTPVMKGLNLQHRASSIICPDHVTERKPHPEPLFLACTQIGCLPENTLYVGDHIRDIESGRRAGMRTIAAGYGYIDADTDIRSWEADHCVDCASEIKPLLQSLYALQ